MMIPNPATILTFLISLAIFLGPLSLCAPRFAFLLSNTAMKSST